MYLLRNTFQMGQEPTDCLQCRLCTEAFGVTAGNGYCGLSLNNQPSRTGFSVCQNSFHYRFDRDTAGQWRGFQQEEKLQAQHTHTVWRYREFPGKRVEVDIGVRRSLGGIVQSTVKPGYACVFVQRLEGPPCCFFTHR
jgi:hypothetical protein